MSDLQSRHCISPLAAWAFAFGCAIGWDSFILPGATFLPKAGPLGAVLGVLLGAVCMAGIAWSYHYLMNKWPGRGGVYSYASKVFGWDHGFLCGWFLSLAYVAIVWMDATVLATVARHAVGNMFDFGFSYHVAGSEIRLGHILLSTASILASAWVCGRRRLASGVQTVLAVVLVAGVLVCFAAAAFRHEGGLRTMLPAFSPEGGSPVLQVLWIVVLSPWLFVGFESISLASAEFRFPRKMSFTIMVAAIGAAAAVYALLSAVPALVPFGEGVTWADRLAGLAGREYPAYEIASGLLGKAGSAVVAAVIVGAIFTNLVGYTFAASRLLAAMADDGTMPAWFGSRNGEGSPRGAIAVIAGLSIVVSALGQTVVSVIFDIAIVGVAVAYAYASAAAVKTAHLAGNRVARATGLFGLVFAVLLIFVFVILPNFTGGTEMTTVSYLVLALWCISGIICFFFLFRRDRARRFGRSTVVWLSLIAVILVMSHIWIRQTTCETTAEAFNDIVKRHEEACAIAKVAHDSRSAAWVANMREKQDFVNRSIMRDSLVQSGITLLALVLMLCLYSIMRKREFEMELEKAKAKSYFFSTVSHDIRTPLNAIIGFSEVLRSGSSSESERNQAIDAIMVSSQTLLGLINDVLDLSKLESGKMQIVPEPTDSAALMRGVVDTFRLSAAKPGLDLRCKTDGLPPLMLDPQRLRQVVFNLVGNAVKFTERGYVELRASYRRERGACSGIFTLEVEDTGCGISEEDKQRIFSAYVQVGSKISRNGGTGLGLAICRQLAAAMGGRLDLESELGRGSTFSVVIPNVKVAGEMPVGTGATGEAGVTGVTGATDATDATGAPDATVEPSGEARRRILVVDDAKMNVMVLKAHLKKIGDFDVATATDGCEAISLLESEERPFDLVLTDMWMPNMDGEGLVKAIRAKPKLASMRVVLVTADVEMRDKVSDFDGILFKPVTMDKLRQAVAGEGS